MRRIGLFGGSFNPVHLGHLLVAQAAREELALDRVFFIPAAQSPFKPGWAPAPGPLRVRLLRLALAGRPWCRVDPQELERGGVSYTVETLRDYARRFPESERYCLIGADHAPLLPQWRAAGELAELARFAIIPRPGRAPEPPPAPFRCTSLRGFPLGVSASDIRDRVRAGLPIDLLTPAPVAEAIGEYRLYL
jgi:nicotinate-nucleotide adenylyltransferase